MKTDAWHAKTVPPEPRAGVLGVIWGLNIALLPVQRMLTSEYGTRFNVFIIALTVVSLLLGRVARPFGTKIWVVFALITPLAAAIAGLHSSFTASLAVGAELAIFAGITPFVLAYFVRASTWFLPLSAFGFLVVQSLSAVIGIVQITYGPVFDLEARGGRANGLATHPNVLGLMCAVAIVLVVHLLVTRRRRIPLLVLVLGINAFALVLTGSLSSLIALGAGLLVIVISHRITFMTVLVGSIATVIVILVSVLLGFDPFGAVSRVEGRIDVVTGEAADGVASLDIRAKTYAFAWHYILQDPFMGVGMDSTNAGTYDGVTVVHNYLLHSWYQGGILFFGVILAVTIAGLVVVAKALRSARLSFPGGLLLIMFTYAFGSAFFHQTQYWLLMSLAFAMAGVVETSAYRPRNVPVNVVGDET